MSQDFSLNTTLLCFHIPRTPLISLRAIFFCFYDWQKKAKRKTWEYRGYSSGCDDGAHRHSERGIHQLLSGFAETLTTSYWLRRELLRRGQEALVVRLNFVFFTDSVSELYGQRMYITFWDMKPAEWVIWIFCIPINKWHINRRVATMCSTCWSNKKHLTLPTECI